MTDPKTPAAPEGQATPADDEPTPAMLSAAFMAWLNFEMPADAEWADGASIAIYKAMRAVATPKPPADAAIIGLIDHARKLGFGREDLPDNETRILLLDMADALLPLRLPQKSPADAAEASLLLMAKGINGPIHTIDDGLRIGRIVSALSTMAQRVAALERDQGEWLEICGMVQDAIGDGLRPGQSARSIPPMNFDTAICQIKDRAEKAEQSLADEKAKREEVERMLRDATADVLLVIANIRWLEECAGECLEGDDAIDVAAIERRHAARQSPQDKDQEALSPATKEPSDAT